MVKELVASSLFSFANMFHFFPKSFCNWIRVYYIPPRWTLPNKAIRAIAGSLWKVTTNSRRFVKPQPVDSPQIEGKIRGSPWEYDFSCIKQKNWGMPKIVNHHAFSTANLLISPVPPTPWDKQHTGSSKKAPKQQRTSPQETAVHSFILLMLQKSGETHLVGGFNPFEKY